MDEQHTRTIQSSVACIRCGYDLRGIEVKGTCPECGGAALESLAASRSITKREVAALICRILALWLGVRSVLQVLLMAVNIAMIASGTQPGADLSWLVFSFAYLAAQVVVLGVLWFGAAAIARLMVPVDGPAMPQQQWSAGDLMTVAVCVLGLFLLATGAAQAVGGIFGEQVARLIAMDPYGGGIIEGAMRAILGLVLVAGRQRLCRWFHKARTAGTPQS